MLVGLLLISLVHTLPAAASPQYPLRKSANGRYLVDQANTPFLMIGDTAWSLMVNISEADAAVYFSSRQAAGFNTVMINLLCNTYTGGRADSSTYDGILPFTGSIAGQTTYDLTTPNEVYFAHVDRILALAARFGMTVFLDPIDTGGYLRPEGTPTMQDNGAARLRAYGQFLGKRYGGFPNIVWQHGNDYDHPYWQTAADDLLVRSVMLGIKEFDPHHLHTIELGAPGGSYDSPYWAGVVDLDATYTWDPTYDQVLIEYRRSRVPVYVVEDHYEMEEVGWPPAHNNAEMGTPPISRKQDYWTMTCGATGKLYGHHNISTFSGDWKGCLNTQAVSELRFMAALFSSHHWYDLVPDMHSLVTAGEGTYVASGRVGASDYLTAARTGDGSLAIIYIPARRTITIDMTNFAKAVDARWYDPTAGTYSKIAGSPFDNVGARNFTPDGNNHADDGDWVLLLEAVGSKKF
jgi:Protein of unknown function (DUF4038)/Putative collagen-binding domain of a collagenase